MMKVMMKVKSEQHNDFFVCVRKSSSLPGIKQRTCVHLSKLLYEYQNLSDTNRKQTINKTNIIIIIIIITIIYIIYIYIYKI